MPGLSTAMQKMSKEGIEDMGAGLTDLFDKIKNATSETEAMALATDAFGAGAGVRFKDAIRSGAMEFDGLLAAMEDSEGKVDALGESTLTTADKMDIMKNRVKGALAPIGGMASSIGPLVILIPGLTTAVSGMTAAMGALNLSMGPILIAIVAIAAAIGVAILIWKNWDTIVEGSKKVWEGLKEAITGSLDGIWSAIKFYINLWIGAFNMLIKGMNLINFKVPSWVPGMGGKGFGFDIPEIPKLAEGGIVNRPTLAMIGEAGAEAVVPLNKGTGGMGGITVNVMMPEGGTVILDDESTAQRFGDFITMQIREVLRTQAAF